MYSRFMAENIGAHAQVPVIALPPPVEPPQEDVVPTRLGVPGGFLFLFVFDYLSTVQRKNPVGLIEAFKLAFGAEEGPQLLIKTINGPLRPLSEEELLWAADGRPDIHVIDRSLQTRELHGLMAGCDCYVSLHRAEGLGLTLAEAMAIGKPAIATGYSGNLDFMTTENSYLVEHTIGRVGPECEIYPPEGEWAEPSLEHAARLMREVYGDGEEAARRGARAREDIARLLSPAATGRRMRERLEHLAAQGGARRGPACRADDRDLPLRVGRVPGPDARAFLGAGLLVRAATGPSSVPGILIVPLGLAVLVIVAGIFCDASATRRSLARRWPSWGSRGCWSDDGRSPARSETGRGGSTCGRSSRLSARGRWWQPRSS